MPRAAASRGRPHVGWCAAAAATVLAGWLGVVRAQTTPQTPPQEPAGTAPAEPSATSPAATAVSPTEAFVEVVRVLQSPRCVNCHPAGNAPTVGDDGRPHAMNVKRGLEKNGLSCQSCHRATMVDPAVGPPAVPGWHMPSAQVPMVFAGRSPRALCEQLKDPAQNGGKTLPQLVEHVRADALVLYGWNPGGGRTLPPLGHATFVQRFEQWVAAGAPCP